MALDFSSIEGHQLHLQEPKDPIALTDGIEVFLVPRKYVAATLIAVPALRYSFEHLGGQHHEKNRGKEAPKEKKFTDVPWKSTH
jgi:hypothetical protein